MIPFFIQKFCMLSIFTFLLKNRRGRTHTHSFLSSLNSRKSISIFLKCLIISAPREAMNKSKPLHFLERVLPMELGQRHPSVGVHPRLWESLAWNQKSEHNVCLWTNHKWLELGSQFPVQVWQHLCPVVYRTQTDRSYWMRTNKCCPESGRREKSRHSKVKISGFHYMMFPIPFKWKVLISAINDVCGFSGIIFVGKLKSCLYFRKNY